MNRHHRVILLAVFTAVVLLQSKLVAQDPPKEEKKRVPSGDLSDFFNPPGIKSGDIRSVTRTIAPKKNKDPATAKSNDQPASDSTADSSDNKSSSDANAGKQPDVPNVISAEIKSGLPSTNAESTTLIEGGISLGKSRVTNWRVGVVILAGANPISDATCRIPIPTDWPEQKVSVFEESLPASVYGISFKKLGNIQLLTFKVSNVPAGERLIATVTYRVETSRIKPPANTSIFRIPDKRTRETKLYLTKSPGIGISDSKMKSQAKQMFDNNQSDWVKVEGLFDWVRENIEERSLKDAHGSEQTFREKYGTAEDKVSLFVAMCRINKVPARIVFVDGSQYAEFYLVDDNKQGHWFPCRVSGIREFGEIGEPRVILQKGDNFRTPGNGKKTRLVPETATFKGAVPRKIGWAREPLSAN